MKKCKECDKLNKEYCYPTSPPKFDCKVTGKCHFLDDVCDVKEEMGKQDKPRLAEVLGVEVGQEFKCKNLLNGLTSYPIYISEKGDPMSHYEGSTAFWILYAINHPDSIIRAPRLTEPEIAIMRAVGDVWVSKDELITWPAVKLWKVKPVLEDGFWCHPEDGKYPVADIDFDLFPSLNPGDCIEVEEEK